MKFPDRFLPCFALAALFLLLGIGILVIQTMVTKPDLVPLNRTELSERYTFHTMVIIPRMPHVYLQLLLSNAGVALFVLLVPLYWVSIWFIRRELLQHIIALMQATVLLLMAALGHNSFSKLYEYYRTLPPDLVVTLYWPHGIPEMIAFVLAGTFSLLCIRDVAGYLAAAGDSPGIHPGEVVLFVLGRTYRIFLAILLLLAVSAVIECYVTPLMVEAAYRTALAGMAG